MPLERLVRLHRDSFLGRRFLERASRGGDPVFDVERERLEAVDVERVGRITGVADGALETADGTRLAASNAVWWTGFEHDYGWIDLDVFGEDGLPRHERGLVEEAPGLAFVGLPGQHRLTSSLIGGVGGTRDTSPVTSPTGSPVGDARSDDGSAPDPNDPYATRIEEATALDDGRTLAYCRFGDPTGEPVFVFHGGVGSRGFGLLFEDAAAELGVRVVSPDRTGYGRSDPQPGRTLLDWSRDVESLADGLDCHRFGVLGISGGGPFAAACGYALPERLTAAALVSSAGPPAAPRATGMRVVLRLARWLPWLAGLPTRRTLQRARTAPDAAIEARAEARPRRRWRCTEATRAGRSTPRRRRWVAKGTATPSALVGRDWGFDLGAIGVPVGVWHGALDRTVPADAARYLAEAIPEARLAVHDDVGHLSLPVTYAEELLGCLFDAAGRVDSRLLPLDTPRPVVTVVV